LLFVWFGYRRALPFYLILAAATKQGRDTIQLTTFVPQITTHDFGDFSRRKSSTARQNSPASAWSQDCLFVARTAFFFGFNGALLLCVSQALCFSSPRLQHLAN